MIDLATTFGRVPKIILFGVAGLIQMGAIGVMVFDRAEILRTGTDVLLQTRPIDPRDLLRGDYVVLGYDISSVPAGALKDQLSPGRNAAVFVKIAPNREGFYVAVSVHASPVDVVSPEVLIRGRAVNGADCSRRFCETLQIRYGIESYFVPEGEGRKLESARNQRKLAIVAAVAPTGRAAIKRLLIDGQPVYDEPRF
jgi:uncharacterized membrane-anchored protein